MEALEPTAGWWRVLWIRVISKRRNHKNSPFAEHSVQPVYQETYDVEKLAAELAADRSKFKELWLPRVRMCCELPPQRSIFGLVDRVPCRGNGVAGIDCHSAVQAIGANHPLRGRLHLFDVVRLRLNAFFEGGFRAASGHLSRRRLRQ